MHDPIVWKDFFLGFIYALLLVGIVWVAVDDYRESQGK